MKFRATRPSEFVEVDVVVVPLFDDKRLPEQGLTRATRAIALRMVDEVAAGKLYEVTTHFGEKTGRIVLSGKVPSGRGSSRSRYVKRWGKLPRMRGKLRSASCTTSSSSPRI